jgi:3-oxoadipate enol-lactonase
MQIRGSNIDIQVNGINTCYDDFGEGNTPIIFIHGFPFNKSMWQPQVEFFSPLQRVIAYDIRGFGKSSSTNEKMSIPLFAEDLIRLMDALELNKAAVCGLSMGGYVLLNAVTRYPKRFEAIILCDTQCIADSPKIKEKRSRDIEQVTQFGLEKFCHDFLGAVFSKQPVPDKHELMRKLENQILTTPAETITGTLLALSQRWSMCSMLHEISLPALILCGEEDRLTPPEQSEFLFKAIRNSQLQIITKAGHLSNLEGTDQFNKHLNNFICSLKK